MVHSVTPEDDCTILNKQKKTKRFTYNKGNIGNDPWLKCKADENENKDLGPSKPLNVTYGYPRPSQFKGKSLANYLDVSKSVNVNNAYPKPSQFQGLNLDNVWSIRNNVPFTSQSHAPATSLNAKPSYYSRYKLLNQGGGSSINEPASSTDQHLKQDTHSWNTKQSQFSYSEANQKSNASADDDEFDHEIPLTNVLKNNQFNNHGNGRPISARTEKARKMHDAYLKSTGLGKYATPSQSHHMPEHQGFRRNLMKDGFD